MSKLVKTLLQNKKTLVLIIGLGLFLSLIPLHSAQAGVWETIRDAVVKFVTLPLAIAALVMVLIIVFFGLMAGLVSFVAIAFLSWVKTVCFNVSIIHGGVVDIGWNFTRDFANMFFILILVFIGLATILKLQEYQAKKTLPLLIIIALLINFSPVLVGFIVDITNIVTNFFLSQCGSNLESLKLIFTRAGEILKLAFGSFIELNFMESLTEMLSAMMFGLALFIFYGFTAVVYFFVVILLIARIIFLWVLVILAPIAFISYIFPATKKLYLIGWDSWWEELVKWSVIGIPIGFFLYLSDWIMAHQPIMESSFKTGELGTTIAMNNPGLSWGEIITRDFADLLASMLAPFVAIVLLYLGVKFAKKLAPEMAIKIVDGVKKGFKIVAGAALTATTLGAGAGFLAGGLGKMAAGASRAEAALGRVSGGGRFITKPLQYVVGKPAKLATRGAEMVAAPGLLKYAARTRETKIPDEFKNMTGEEQVQFMRTQTHKFNPLVKLKYFSNMKEEAFSPVREAKRDEEGKVIKEKYTDEKGRERERTVYEAKENPLAKEAGDLANRYATDPHGKENAKAIKQMLPDTMDEKTLLNIKLEGEVDSEDIKKTKDELNKKIDKELEHLRKREDFKESIALRLKLSGGKITEEQAARDIAAASIYTGELKDTSKISKSSFETTAVKMGSLHWDGRQLGKAVEEGGKKFVEKWMEAAEKLGVEWFLKYNQKALLYLSGNAAQDAGFNAPEKLTRQDVRELIELWKAES